jgi:pyridoxamine 5'-phosphate oxidase
LPGQGLDDRGFVWYTNYESRKSGELGERPFAALTFWWGDLERSVRVEGSVERVAPQESDEYFGSRPRGSQVLSIAANAQP